MISKLNKFYKLEKHYQIYILMIGILTIKKIAINAAIKRKIREVKVVDIQFWECINNREIGWDIGQPLFKLCDRDIVI